MEQIQTILNYYTKLAERYTHQASIKALKKQYRDVCSNGDIIINRLIDILDKEINNNNAEKYIVEFREKYSDKEYFDNVMDHLIESIEEFYKDGLNPNPYWAA